MRDSGHAHRLIGSPGARLLAVAALVTGVLVTGCGASSPGLTAARAGGATASRSGTSAGGGSASSRSTAPSAGGTGPLAFAKCMRAHGVPSFPDPSAGRGARVSIPIAGNPAAPVLRAAQAKCQKLVHGPVGGPFSPGATTHPSAQTLARLLKIAGCMRQHGVPQFPDPRTTVPSSPTGDQEISDFDGAILVFPATINLEAPAYRQALTACGAPPLGLPH